MSEPFFATGYIRLLYRFVNAQVSETALLKGTGYSASDVMRADFEMPFSAQMCLIENALTHSSLGLALRLGQQLQLAAHGALGTAMQTAPNLRVALSTFAELIGARASFFSLCSREEQDSVCIEISLQDLPAKVVPFFTESVLLTLTNCITYFAGHDNNVLCIELAYPSPSYAADYASVFGNTVAFSRPTTTLSFERSLLTLSSPEVDVARFEESLLRCRSALDELGRRQDIARGVENFLWENPGRLWSVEELAPLFAMSARTLVRQLKKSGTNYQSLRDGVLKQQSVNNLKSMTVEATAFALGFAEPSSFRRAFKRWFGVAPSSIRASR